MTGLELILGAAILGKLTAGPPVTSWGYVDGQPVQLELVDVGAAEDGHRLFLRVDVAAAWNAMKAAAAAVGVYLKLNSAFRTFEQQQALRALYEAGKGPAAAQPGYSAHQEAVAVDVESDGGRNAAFHWMTANADRYGFRRTVAAEPWHWEHA